MHFVTLLIASIGGALLNFTNLPLAWLLGAMFSVALCSLFTKRFYVPNRLRFAGTAILGTVVGSLVNADIFHLLVQYAPSIGAMLGFQLLLVCIGTWFILRYAGADRLSGLLAAYPGSISQITAISLDNKCNTQLIAVNHTCRLFLVIAFIPLAITAFSGDIIIEQQVVKEGHNGFINYALPMTIALTGYLIGDALKIMTPSLFGPMILAAIFSMTGLLPNIPTGEWLIPLAQIIIGASVGLRFQNMSSDAWKNIASIHLPYGLTLLTMTLAAGWSVHILLEIPFETSLLIMAPGGLSEMVLIAFALDIDPVMVTSHHVIRSLFGFLLIPWLMQLWAKTKTIESPNN
ncbi:MAG: AbrB family transcriptional regulator [Cellvibrionaceae bacterium]